MRKNGHGKGIIQVGQWLVRATERAVGEDARAISKIETAPIDRCNPRLQHLVLWHESTLGPVLPKTAEEHIIGGLEPG